MIIPPGATSVSVDVFFADDTGAAVTAKAASDFPACKWSSGTNTADTTITLSDLAAITTAHPNDNTAGGIKEREGGWYRLDLPNNMFTSAGRKTLTFAETTNKRIIAPFIDCQYTQADARQWLGGTIPAVNVTGVPLVDAKYLLGTIFSTPATAGILDANIKNVNNVAYGSSTLNTLASHDPGATIGTSTLTQSQVTGGAYALSTDANGRIRIVDGTAAGELDTTSGKVDVNDKTGFRLSATGVDDVWDEAISGHLTAGTTGAALNAAGSAGDPWSTLLPGVYGAGTAGKIIGDNINATISSRSSHSAADVWAAGTRTLTAGTNIALAKGTGVTGFNDITAAAAATAVWTDLLAGSDFSTVASIGKLLKDDIDAAISSRGTSTLTQAQVTGGSYALDTDSNGRVRIVDGTGTGEIDTTSGGVAVTAASVRSAMGLASANLDTQFSAIPTANANADALLDRASGIETSVTLRQAMRALAAVCCGTIADAGTGTETYKSIGGSTTRLVYTVDASGNRQAVTLSL